MTLHAKSLNITTGDVHISALSSNDKECNHNLTIARTEFQNELDFFVIHMNDTIEKGCRLELVIPFQNDLKDDLEGYYRNSYINKRTNEKRYVIHTLSTNT